MSAETQVTPAAPTKHGDGPVAVPVSELMRLEMRARLGAYAASDAVWVAGLPLLVNRDFDFAMALGLPAVGAGMAAARRRQENAALAERLAVLGPLDPQALLQRACSERPSLCAELSGTRVRVYALLFGGTTARLRTHLELESVDPRGAIYASISTASVPERLLEPGVLRVTLESELVRALELRALPAQPASEERGRCAAGDGDNIAGEVIARVEGRVTFASSDPEGVLVSCMADAFRADVNRNTIR